MVFKLFHNEIGEWVFILDLYTLCYSDAAKIALNEDFEHLTLT